MCADKVDVDKLKCRSGEFNALHDKVAAREGIHLELGEITRMKFARSCEGWQERRRPRGG